jgi:hypothetical protein
MQPLIKIDWPVAALVLLVFSTLCQAQISTWQLGGNSGLQWATSDTNSILVDRFATSAKSATAMLS